MMTPFVFLFNALCASLLLYFSHGLTLQQTIISAATRARQQQQQRRRPAPVATSSSLAAVSSSSSSQQVAILDGAEWTSLQIMLMQEHRIPRGRKLSNIGKMTLVTGTTTITTDNDNDKPKQQQRVVGIQAPSSSSSQEEQSSLLKTVPLDHDDDIRIYADSMAIIPSPKISDDDAMATLWASLVGVHCALPVCRDVGGDVSYTSNFVSGKTVVVGGSDYASFAAKALAAMGATVVQVSTTKTTGSTGGSGSAARPSNNNQDGVVQHLTPAVGELELGFAAVVGEFDVLLDTLHDEAKLGGMYVTQQNDDDDDDVLHELVSPTSGVVAELRKQHKCNRYVSTLSHSQAIIRDEGVLWGPKKASSHAKDVSKGIDRVESIVPPQGFSMTLQTLLDKGVTWKAKNEKMLMRGWALKDFWELTSWPRDSSGAGDTRYGLPVMEDFDTIIQERMISEPPPSFSLSRLAEEQQEIHDRQNKEDAENPHVMAVRGVEGLQRDIIAPQRDCLLFLSAPWCRTCRYLSPQYTRMARDTSADLTFAKADASGSIGKALGRALEVDAVPAFVLFRQGEVYGSPLSISRLPSKKLEQALHHLASGMEWNSEILDEEL